MATNFFQEGKQSPLPMFNPGLANVGKYVPSGQLPTPIFSQGMVRFMADTHHKSTTSIWICGTKAKIRHMGQQGFITSQAIRLPDKLSFCNSCAATAANRVKAHRKMSCGSAKPAHPIHEIGTNVAGPFLPDRHGNKHYCVFQYRFTKYRAIFPMKTKNDNILSYVLYFVESAERSSPDTSSDDVAVIRMDSGGEYVWNFEIPVRILDLNY